MPRAHVTMPSKRQRYEGTVYLIRAARAQLLRFSPYYILRHGQAVHD